MCMMGVYVDLKVAGIYVEDGKHLYGVSSLLLFLC